VRLATGTSFRAIAEFVPQLLLIISNSEPHPHFMERAGHGVMESAGQVTPTMIDEEGPIME